MLKGQAQPVVMMLTATVLIGSIGTVYVWGEPLLTKGQQEAKIENIEQDAVNLLNTINRVAQSGEGTTEVIRLGEGISASGEFEIEVNESGNYVEISESAQNPPYPIGSWTLLSGESLQNLTIGSGSYALKGDHQAGVLAVRPLGVPEDTLISYRTEFRNLYTTEVGGEKLERINLKSTGVGRVNEPSTLVITNQGSKWDRGSNAVKVEDGRMIERENTEIKLEFR